MIPLEQKYYSCSIDGRNLEDVSYEFLLNDNFT